VHFLILVHRKKEAHRQWVRMMYDGHESD
jgi:hypothetical protein